MIKAWGVGCIVVFYRDPVAALCGLGRLGPVVLACWEGAVGAGGSSLPLGCIGSCEQPCPPSSWGWTDSSGSMESLDAELNLHLCVPDLGFFSAAGLIPWLKVMAKTGWNHFIFFVSISRLTRSLWGTLGFAFPKLFCILHLLLPFRSHPLQWLQWAGRAHHHISVEGEPYVGCTLTFPEVRDVKALYSPNHDVFSCRLLVHLLFRAHWRCSPWPGAHVALVHGNFCTVASSDLSSRPFHAGRNKSPGTLNRCFHVWFKEAPQHAGFMGIAFVCTRAGFRVPVGRTAQLLP